MNGLFCGNSCTWVLILVIVFLLSQGTYYNDCGDYRSGYERQYNNGNGCGCGCNN